VDRTSEIIQIGLTAEKRIMGFFQRLSNELETLDNKVGKLIAEKLALFVQEGGNIDKLERKLSLDFDRKFK